MSVRFHRVLYELTACALQNFYNNKKRASNIEMPIVCKQMLCLSLFFWIYKLLDINRINKT